MAANLNQLLNANRKKSFVNPNKKKYDKRIPKSEYFTPKYDDIDRDERIVLTHMASDVKKHWTTNDFRFVPSFRNDGKKIADVISSLNQKRYIRRTDLGWKLWHLNTKK